MFGLIKFRVFKHISIILLSMVFFFTLAVSTSSAFIIGDVNNDGRIDIQDVAIVMKHVLGIEILTSTQKEAADVNSDGIINIQDASLILQKLLGIIDNFDPDPDPTPDPASSGTVNINTAGFEDLRRIIHIDEDRAQQIIDKRPFTSWDDFRNRVSGIGPTRLREIQEEGIAYID